MKERAPVTKGEAVTTVPHRPLAHDLLINVGVRQMRVAVVAGGRLRAVHHYGAPGGAVHLKGGLFLGRVTRVVPGLAAAFVDILPGVTGFLPAREAQRRWDRPPVSAAGGPAPIQRCVAEGETLLVQVLQDARGDKGPKLTSDITLAGRYLVLAPAQGRVAVSKRITDDGVRARLVAVGEECLAALAQKTAEIGLPAPGLILRTAAEAVDGAALHAEANQLGAAWLDICGAARRRNEPRRRLDEAGDPVIAALRHQVTPETRHIFIDDRRAFSRARSYALAHAPDLVPRLFVVEDDTLFDRYNLEADIETALDARVTLPCGGWMTFESTEGLTAVDVNSGSFVHPGGAGQTACQVNLEAAAELGIQLRLRAIGGLIVVDFIQMDRAEDRARVEAAVIDALSADPAPCQVAPLSVFGVMELTRRRGEDLLQERLTRATRAPRRRLRWSELAARLYRGIEREARAARGLALSVRAEAGLLRWIEEHDGAAFDDLRARIGAGLTVEGVEDWPRGRFDVVARR